MSQVMIAMMKMTVIQLSKLKFSYDGKFLTSESRLDTYSAVGHGTW